MLGLCAFWPHKQHGRARRMAKQYHPVALSSPPACMFRALTPVWEETCLQSFSQWVLLHHTSGAGAAPCTCAGERTSGEVFQ